MGNIKSDIQALADFVDNIDFDSVLSTAELVASFAPIPYLSKIISLLRFFVRHKQHIAIATTLTRKASNAFDDSDNFTPLALISKGTGSSNERDMALIEDLHTNEKMQFQQLLEVAKMDGVISPEEREFLIPRGVSAGYSMPEIEAMLKI